MKNLKTGLFLIVFHLFYSCGQKKEINGSLEIIRNIPQIKINEIYLDTISIGYDGFIGKGFSVISGEKIHFLNLLKMELIEFDQNGEFLGVLISSGEGPSEIPKFQSYLEGKGDKYFMDGYTIFTYDSLNNLKQRKMIDFYHRSSMESVETNPDPNDPGVYEVKYWSNELGVINNFLYTKIESSNPKFNFVMHEEYYRNAKLYAKIDLSTGKVLEILGKRPLSYLNYRFIPHFDYFYHDFLQDEIYLSFEPDSLIYITDLNFEFKEAFGNKGKFMDSEYIQVNNIEDWESYWKNNRVHKGFYKYLKYFPEDDILFRTYTLGNEDHTKFEYEDNPQRLQIYKNKTLIGDVKVPNTFKVIGKIGDFYYADGSIDNPNNEKIVVYRFKLP